MLMVSEQQTYTKLRLAPEDFIKMLEEDEAKALEYINNLQAARSEVKERKKKEPTTNADGTPVNKPTKRGRRSIVIDFSKL